ncbi:hypothetical protein CHS0354_022544 [Potamilus streckersoni]|uniref:protein-tyrosine-phosphatase n=1 Tax=Potamilus streckersoni TaxID=2493646 RepID=A0AAE0TCF7_9BIVA|nr:hypothetical protein CHS0354_022544 [Potamilus streckersoni]
MSQIEREFDEYDQNNLWPIVYQKIKNDAYSQMLSEEFSTKEARKPENRSKNRYRDVSPYDHSRVVLESGDSDYINASIIEVPEAKRRYILSQGPLEHTAGHFWQMVWEQNARAIIMLNKVIEKGSIKCYQYWPVGSEQNEYEMVFEDIKFKVSLLDEEFKNNYFLRKLELEQLETGSKREVLHYQYVSWPDFGVPPSPITFLNFLMAVRQEGVLEKDVGQAVIHCSAGIGRSGTFCLVDSCLIMIEKNQSMEGLDITAVLLSMRSFRMGLIQTHDQLRFSYLAVIEGGRRLLQIPDKDVSSVMDAYLEVKGKEDKPPPPPQRTSSLPPNRREQVPPPPPPRDFDQEEETTKMEEKRKIMQEEELDKNVAHKQKKIKTEQDKIVDSVVVSPSTVNTDSTMQNNNYPGSQKDMEKRIQDNTSPELDPTLRHNSDPSTQKDENSTERKNPNTLREEN